MWPRLCPHSSTGGGGTTPAAVAAAVQWSVQWSVGRDRRLGCRELLWKQGKIPRHIHALVCLHWCLMAAWRQDWGMDDGAVEQAACGAAE